MKLIEALLFIVSLVILYKLISFLTRRMRGIFKILALRRECGLSVRLLRSPLLTLFGTDERADAAVEIGDDVYLLRFVSGRSGRKHFHFASKRFYVTFSSMRITLGALLNVGRRYKVTRGSGYQTTSSHSVKILPELRIPEEYGDGRKRIIPVLILNPAPTEVTYVTEERTAIKAAFEGDDVYGQRIFTASTFFIYADRVKRQSEIKDPEKAIFRE